MSLRQMLSKDRRIEKDRRTKDAQCIIHLPAVRVKRVALCVHLYFNYQSRSKIRALSQMWFAHLPDI